MRFLFLLALLALLAGAQAKKCPDGLICPETSDCCPFDSLTSFMCCASDESCCSDPADVGGGECCIKQTSYCCKKSGLHPSRCCPRWTICCSASVSEGCCTPLGHPWQPWMGLEEPSAEYVKRFGGAEEEKEEKKPASSGAVIHTLFVEVDKVFALTIDAETGAALTNKKVDFDNHSEMTRIFMFDEHKEVFYYLETDFVKPPGPNGRAITLFTISAIDGTVKKTPVQGAYNFVTGYEYHGKLDAIFFATQVVDKQEAVTGYNFYRMDTTSGQAKLLSTTGVAGDDVLAGWFHDVTGDGKTAVRLGFRNVDTQAEPGIALVDITASKSTTKWIGNVPQVPNHKFYSSVYPKNDNSGFYSLAPKNPGPGFDLVLWALNGNATIICDLGNDTTPRLFGNIAETVSLDEKIYVAAVYKNGDIPLLDHWDLAVVDITTGKLKELEVKPHLVGGMSSVTGVGVPAASQRILRDKLFGDRR